MEVQPALTVRGPADLICAVPYLLGFHPESSLVVVGLASGCVVVTVRVDLEGMDADGVLEHAVAAMRRGGAADFVGIVVDAEATDASATASDGPLPWHGLAVELADAIEAVDGVVGDILLVAGGRYWSYLCRAQGCCPPDGTEIPADGSEIAATATYAGMVALPGREDVARLLDPLPIRQRAALAPILDEAMEAAASLSGTATLARWNRADIRELLTAASAFESDPASVATDPEVLARYGAALRQISVRDAMWMEMDAGHLVGDGLWRHLARVLPPPYDAAPLFLVGWAAWRDGSGVLARIAGDRAIDSDPTYSAAELLLAALDNAVDPRSVPKLRRHEQKCDR